MEIVEFLPAYYDEALALWKRCEGIGLSEADDSEPMQKFLHKNPGLNCIALEGGRIVGTCLCGSDGRRGYLYHLAVDPAQRRKGIGKRLVERTLQALAEQGIQKCHIMVFGSNESGLAFWKSGEWITRSEIVLMSHNVGCRENRGAC
jgi:ribosomal protein S18 acetylase RimI-like enzyme